MNVFEKIRQTAETMSEKTRQALKRMHTASDKSKEHREYIAEIKESYAEMINMLKDQRYPKFNSFIKGMLKGLETELLNISADTSQRTLEEKTLKIVRLTSKMEVLRDILSYREGIESKYKFYCEEEVNEEL